MDARRYLTLRRRVYSVLDVAMPGDVASAVVHRVLVALIVLSVLAVVLETMPALSSRYELWFEVTEVLAAVIFSIEYFARLWASVEHPAYAGMRRGRARLAYVISPGAVVDLLAILPFFLTMLLPAELQVLLVFRLARFFKLARYSPGLRSLLDAVSRERRALAACLVIIFGLMLVTASLMHVVEGGAQPDKFGSIPEAMWWSIVTLTTVGYGDAVPITVLGKMVAGVTAVLGLVMLALPVGIIATSFAEVIHRRDFVVTWGMVARVPLFADLKAGEIAEIMSFLRSRTVPSGETIVRRGDRADCMFFIAGGIVEVELPHRRVTMGEGQFFGEMAVIHKVRRTATVRAVREARLLVLDVEDFHAILHVHPDIARRIEETAHSRGLDGPASVNAGDIEPGELDPVKTASPGSASA